MNEVIEKVEKAAENENKVDNEIAEKAVRAEIEDKDAKKA